MDFDGTHYATDLEGLHDSSGRLISTGIGRLGVRTGHIRSCHWVRRRSACHSHHLFPYSSLLLLSIQLVTKPPLPTTLNAAICCGPNWKNRTKAVWPLALVLSTVPTYTTTMIAINHEEDIRQPNASQYPRGIYLNVYNTCTCATDLHRRARERKIILFFYICTQSHSIFYSKYLLYMNNNIEFVFVGCFEHIYIFILLLYTNRTNEFVVDYTGTILANKYYNFNNNEKICAVCLWHCERHHQGFP